MRGAPLWLPKWYTMKGMQRPAWDVQNGVRTGKPGAWKGRRGLRFPSSPRKEREKERRRQDLNASVLTQAVEISIS
jgi:hypothetical protein